MYFSLCIASYSHKRINSEFVTLVSFWWQPSRSLTWDKLNTISEATGTPTLDFGPTWFSMDCNLPLDDHRSLYQPNLGCLHSVIEREMVKPYHWQGFKSVAGFFFHKTVAVHKELYIGDYGKYKHTKGCCCVLSTISFHFL